MSQVHSIAILHLLSSFIESYNIIVGRDLGEHNLTPCSVQATATASLMN